MDTAVIELVKGYGSGMVGVAVVMFTMAFIWRMPD